MRKVVVRGGGGGGGVERGIRAVLLLFRVGQFGTFPRDW